ncbi:MAG: DNA primase small subunit PriS [Candidatus Bathyarchaeia archaeon]|nr:DNA primase small subunit PriS [Candidatus Bathyarchaeota archaeon]
MEVDDFIKKWFSNYYRTNIDDVISPRSISKREFGFIIFKGRTMVRHRGFKDPGELKRFIIDLTPADAYHSSAYYERPEAGMDEKGWLGSDLIFDIDADHLSLPCKLRHDRWMCLGCGKAGVGDAPESCPKCGGKIREESWICEECLNTAKREVVKLTDFLTDDFGFSQEELHVNFTGHRGYHVHVISDKVSPLGREERKEIVDYVTGTGVDLSLLNLRRENSFLDAPNWMRKILGKLGSKDAVPKGKRQWIKAAQQAINEVSVKIDTVVTTDIHRLIRMEGTLNSKTGMKVVKIPLNRVDLFDPFKDAVAIKGGEAEVYVEEAPRFRLMDQEFGPYSKVKVELPIEAAVLLLCKGRAYPII